jgi:hypothetical protein
MKIAKIASGKQKIKLSKKEWKNIGEKAGWMCRAKHEAQENCPEKRCPECGEIVWDVATIDQHLNKCWKCGLKFLNDCEQGSKMKITKTANKTKFKLSKQEWTDLGKKAGWMKEAKWIAVDNPFNRANYKDQIGKVYENPPGYIQVEKFGSDPWEMIPEHLVKQVSIIARKQGISVKTKEDAYKYAKEDEDALELLLPYADFDM